MPSPSTNFMAGPIGDSYKRDDVLSIDHKAIVVDNNDPLKLRRVRCIVEGLFESKNWNHLPWCMPGNEGGSAGSRPGLGSFRVPSYGSIVGVYFPTGDLYAPYYKSWADDSVDTSSQLLFGEDYPYTYGNVDESGSWVRANCRSRRSNRGMDFEESYEPSHDIGFAEFFHAISQAFVHVDGKGNVLLRVPSNLVIQVAGDISIKSLSAMLETTNDVALKSGQAIGVEAKTTIGLKSGGDTSIESATLYENSGVVYDTVASQTELTTPYQEDLQSYREKLVNLSREVKNADSVAQSNILTFAKALVGTRSR